MATGSHGLHEYSTFSASTVNSQESHHKDNEFNQCCCFLCRLSSSLVLHPVGPFRCAWDMIVMSLLIYTSIEIPFTMSFGQSQYILYVGLFVDCVLFIDIIFNFHTAYFDKYDNLRLITNKKYICKKYIRTWFFIDIFTCLPYELMDRNEHSADTSDALVYIKVLRIFRLLRIIKMLRLLKMLKIFDVFRKQFIVREVMIGLRLFKIIFGMLIFAHFAACSWYFVGLKTSPSWIDGEGLRSDDIDTFTKYSYAWYWSVVTLFTTGYGDIVATNTTEQWVSSICILIGTCFFAYFVGTLTVLITEGDKVRSYEIDKLEEAQIFCEKKKLPKELTHAICTHIRYHCRYNYVFDETELLGILPSYLQHDIHSCVAKQFLLNIGIFQNEHIDLPEFIIGLIAVKCKAISCNQSFKLYDIGDMAKEFYIQRTGKSVMYDKNGKILQPLSRGCVCGEYDTFLFKKRKVKVQCETWSEFYCISIDDIKQILEEYYPKSSYVKWKRMTAYIKESYAKNIKHCVQFEDYAQYKSLHATRLVNASSHSLIKLSKKIINSVRVECLENKNSEAPIAITDLQFDEKSKLSQEESTPQLSPTPNDSRTGSIQHKKSLSQFTKFKIRSNSHLRNVVVIAHGEKHNKLSITKSDTAIKHFRSHTVPNNVQIDATDIARAKTIELGPIGPNNNNKMDSVHYERKQSEHYSIYDSECSMSSLVTESSENDIHQKKKKIKAKQRKNKNKRNPKKRRKMGKFGGRRTGKFGGNQKRPHGLSRNISEHEQLSVRRRNNDSESESIELVALNDQDMDESDTDSQIKRKNSKSSLDSSILLATLNVNENENNENNENNVNNIGMQNHMDNTLLMIPTNSVNSFNSETTPKNDTHL